MTDLKEEQEATLRAIFAQVWEIERLKKITVDWEGQLKKLYGDGGKYSARQCVNAIAKALDEHGVPNNLYKDENET